jgi:uroporphyrinogen decarboxylase
LGPAEGVAEGVRRVIASNAGRPGHVFNLGHGILPQTPVENALALVEAVRRFGRS